MPYAEHVASLDFNDIKDPSDNLLEMLIDRIYDADPLEFRLLCLEVYNRNYRMLEGEEFDEDHPWATVLKLNKESLVGLLPRDYYYDQFVNNTVHKLNGLSWAEFVKLPCDEARRIIDKSREHNIKVFEMEKEAHEKMEAESLKARGDRENQLREFRQSLKKNRRR